MAGRRDENFGLWELVLLMCIIVPIIAAEDTYNAVKQSPKSTGWWISVVLGVACLSVFTTAVVVRAIL